VIYGNLMKLNDSSHSAYFQALGADLNLRLENKGKRWESATAPLLWSTFKPVLLLPLFI